MIYHFIRRDFITHKFYWIILALISVVGVPSLLASEYFSMLPFYAYGFFGVIPISNLTGVTWRSQHIMSRNYMLALPVNRKQLFLITQIRALVFWIPFLLLAISLPSITKDSSITLRMFPLLHHPVFYPMVVLAIIWIINTMITMQLATERVTSYLSQQSRAKAWVKIMGVYLGEGAIVVCLFLSPNFIGKYLSPVPAFVIIVLLAGIRYSLSRKRWLGAQ